MKKHFHNNEISKLILQDFLGDISERDQEKLDSWKNEHPENLKLYNQIFTYISFERYEIETKHFDADKAWDGIERLISVKKRRSIRLQVLKYAAIFLLPLLIGGVIYKLFLDQKSSVSQQISSTIQPGTQKAELILHQGNIIDLDNLQDTSILETGGTVIQKKAAMLDYAGMDNKSDNEELIYNTVRVPRGGEYNLKLSDGTHVYLNSMSQLKFPVQFSGKLREVELTGEAYFDVEENMEKPFIVKTKNATLEVLGTSFNVKAYEGENNEAVTLEKGRVKVSGDLAGEVILNPGYQSVIDIASNNISVKKVDPWLYTGWKNGKFYFHENRLEDIMSTLTRWYDAKVFYYNPSVKELKFSGILDKYEDINSIIDIIALTDEVKVEIKNKTIVFYEK